LSLAEGSSANMKQEDLKWLTCRELLMPSSVGTATL